MPYNIVADSFHTKKVCSNFFQAIAILLGKRPFCVLSPLPWRLGATYDVHLRPIIKRVVDFLLALIDSIAEALRANID